CNESCLERFAQNPGAFLQPAAGERPRPPAGATFICPMDPDVRQSMPGACPRCGMALEPDLSNPAAFTTTQYTCPMHPEIVRDAPGSCPICGMALEPRLVSVDEVQNPELAQMTRRFWVGVALTIPILVVAMADFVPGLSALMQFASPRAWQWLEFILATPVVSW